MFVHDPHAHDEHGYWLLFVEWSVAIINAVGAGILIVGAAACIINTGLLVFASINKTTIPPLTLLEGNKPHTLTLTFIRIQLGTFVTFALQFLVVADILDTMSKPVEALEMGMLFKLALVVGVRELLAFLMSKVQLAGSLPAAQ